MLVSNERSWETPAPENMDESYLIFPRDSKSNTFKHDFYDQNLTNGRLSKDEVI